MLFINERKFNYKKGMRLADLADDIKPGADLFIINGFPASANTVLKDGDKCWIIKKGEIPGKDEINHLLYARHTPGVQDKVKNAVVGIMGLGGLGSVVAIALARIGVGRLLLADYDVVEPTNLNRQQYFMDQIGQKKTVALKANLARINPYVVIETIDQKLTEDSIPELFKSVDALAECFDVPDMKAAAFRAALTGLNGVGYVGSSGLAGHGANNTITTRKLYPNVYIVGDGTSAACEGQGLMAPRVGIAAHHQANKILQILLKKGRA
ncbi:MAG: sulfur carrier protein ThiS adenylyltransferase ThiF [Proteobacteria bacterium]|nr:sulfur carrier protein ThiS adenylyltransferase ThiF [Pseudomonadota bacterium]MBU1710013.1 sulfur carrier protein ThiS adenylyltransferase ThiF [Pseudomonadota bacterium]